MDPDAYSKPMRERVDAVLKHISTLMDKATANSATDAQGNNIIILFGNQGINRIYIFKELRTYFVTNN